MYDMCKNKDNFIVHLVFVYFSFSEEQLTEIARRLIFYEWSRTL